MKQCSKCYEYKDYSEFNKWTGHGDGYNPNCKSCRKDYNKKYYRNNPQIKERIKTRRKDSSFREKENKRNKQWRLDNPERFKQRSKYYRQTLKARFNRSKAAAKRRQKNFDLTLEQFQELCDQQCHYCSNELGTKTKTLGGFDRINNSLGYTIDNVIPCCSTCNILRGSNLTQEETFAAVKAILLLRRAIPKSNT